MRNIENYPKTILVEHFPQGADKRDTFLSYYSEEVTVNNGQEESDFYCSLNHEANLKILVYTK